MLPSNMPHSHNRKRKDAPWKDSPVTVVAREPHCYDLAGEDQPFR